MSPSSKANGTCTVGYRSRKQSVWWEPRTCSVLSCDARLPSPRCTKILESYCSGGRGARLMPSISRHEVMPRRLDSSLRFIDIKLSVSRSLRLYSRLLLVRRDNPTASVCLGCTRRSESRPAPSRKAHNVIKATAFLSMMMMVIVAVSDKSAPLLSPQSYWQC